MENDNLNPKNGKGNTNFITNRLQFDVILNAIDPLKQFNKWLFELLFLIDDSSFCKIYVIKFVESLQSYNHFLNPKCFCWKYHMLIALQDSW